MENLRNGILTITTLSCIFVKLQQFSSFLLDWSILNFIIVSLNTETLLQDSFFLPSSIHLFTNMYPMSTLCQVLCETHKKVNKALIDLHLYPQYLAHYNVCTQEVL